MIKKLRQKSIVWTLIVPLFIWWWYDGSYNEQWRIIKSKYQGVSIGLTKINREKIGLPNLPENWIVHPNNDSYSAIQYRINPDSSLPKHYIKYTWSEKRYGELNYEYDRYQLEKNNYSSKELFIGYSYIKRKKGENPWECYLRIYPLLENRDMINWSNEYENLDSLTLPESIRLLDSCGIKNIRYKRKTTRNIL